MQMAIYHFYSLYALEISMNVLYELIVILILDYSNYLFLFREFLPFPLKAHKNQNSMQHAEFYLIPKILS
jgi:hypothetical protein